MVFLGTSVVSGTATAEVITTGAQTAFGDIAARLGARPEATAFDLGLRKFSQLLTRTFLFLVLFLIVRKLCKRNLQQRPLGFPPNSLSDAQTLPLPSEVWPGPMRRLVWRRPRIFPVSY